jgi:hypothetical protein
MLYFQDRKMFLKKKIKTDIERFSRRKKRSSEMTIRNSPPRRGIDEFIPLLTGDSGRCAFQNFNLFSFVPDVSRKIFMSFL